MIEVLDKGVIDYGEAWREQQERFDALLAPAAEPSGAGSAEGARGVLMLCEHPHVYTLGKSGRADNLLVSETFLASIGAGYYHIDRGGILPTTGTGSWWGIRFWICRRSAGGDWG